MIIKMRFGEKDGLNELIKELPNDIIMAEIGSYAGESTELFLDSGKVKTLYVIDPWKNGYDDRDPASNSNMLEVETLFNLRMNVFTNNNKDVRVVKHKMTFNEAFELLPELDFIYIDGDHTYDGVLNDILLAKKKVKIGGIISGHDYRKENSIVVAVNEILGAPEHIFSDTSWMKKNK